VLVYRICRKARQKLDGEGARLYGGRWNSPGRVVVYTAGTLSLGAIEYLVHVNPGDAPNDLIATTLEVPDDIAREIVKAADLPAGWDKRPLHAACREVGDAWLQKSRTLLLQVPSAPITGESNYLLNPAHAAMSRIRVVGKRAFVFDRRLIRR
jgi:RES domain-containing protein